MSWIMKRGTLVGNQFMVNAETMPRFSGSPYIRIREYN